MACGVPFVAAAVGTMNELLEKFPACLYEPENPKSLAESILRQLKEGVIVDGEVPSWADSAQRLENFFAEVIRSDANRFKTEPGIETAH